MNVRLLVALAIAGTALSGCAGYSSFTTIEDAGWMPGYSWAYSASMSAHSERNFVEDGVRNETMSTAAPDEENVPLTPAFSYTVFNTGNEQLPYYLTVATLGAPSTRTALYGAQPGLASSYSTTGVTVVAFGKNDLAARPTQVMVTPTCLACPGNTAPSVEPQVNVGKLSADRQLLRFPLKASDTWTRTLNDDGGAKVVAQVRGLHSVDGPSGKVDAVRISHSLQVDQDALLKEMRAKAAQQGITISELTYEISAETDLDYAPSLHNVVRQTSVSSEVIHAVFAEDGHDFSVDISNQQRTEVVLTAASLEEKPAQTVAEAAGGKVDIPVLPGSSTISIDGIPDVVNAAETPVVKLTAKAGANATSLRWTLEDAAGSTLESGSGPTFEASVDRAGTYLVRLSANVNGAPASVSRPLMASYVRDVAVTCATASVYFSSSCEVLDVPVGPGIGSLTVAFTRRPLASEPGFGELQLTDGRGSTERATLVNQQAQVTTVPEVFTQETWELQYVPTAGVNEAGTYHVDAQPLGNGPVAVERTAWWSLAVPAPF